MATAFLTYPFVVGPGEGIDAPLGRLGTMHKIPAFVTEGRAPDAARAMALTLVSAYEGATLLARTQHTREPLDRAAEAMIRLVDLDR